MRVPSCISLPIPSLVLAALLFSAGPAQALNVGYVFTYQGSLADNGSAPTALYDFRFLLFDAASSGTQLGLVTVNDLQVNGGIFSVDLDFGMSAFDAGAVWLQIEIRPGASTGSYTTLPRQRINPTPFAIGLSLPMQQTGFAATPLVSLTNASIGSGGEFVAGPYVTGDGTLNYGLIGRTPDNRLNAAGVRGENTAASGQVIGVEGVATNSIIGTGLVGRGGATGVYGEAQATNGVGIRGVGTGTNAIGVIGDGASAGGSFYGTTSNSNGLLAIGQGTGSGVFASNSTGTAVYATGTGQYRQGATVRINNGQSDAGMCQYVTNNSTWATTHMQNDGTGEVLWLEKPQAGNFLVATTGTDWKFWLDGAGMTHTKSLEILGGSDLSERFDVHGQSAPEPGTVVSIDSRGDGQLEVSSEPYDHRVAGVISGANGVRTGMLMGQDGTAASGDHPVALTGRVYCKVTTANGPIRPGDLLTTSSRPGYAMRASDPLRSQGALLGKAMGSLETGEGLVLVLVGLQ